MLNQLKEKRSLPQSPWDQYQHLWQRQVVPARTVLLREGEVARKMFYVESGCLRIAFNHDGKDVTFQFFLEGAGVSSLESLWKKQPSLYSIEAIEPSIIHSMDKKDFDKILEETPALKDYMLETMVDRMANYVAHYLSVIKDNPQQRYIKLLQEKPEIVQRIPQHYIASYLGITPVSLSRIRNRI